MEQLCISH